MPTELNCSGNYNCCSVSILYQPPKSLTHERGFPRKAICDSWGAGYSREGAMPAAVGLREDWDAAQVRTAARAAQDAGQVRRLLAIAAIYEGKDWAAGAHIGAMDG